MLAALSYYNRSVLVLPTIGGSKTGVDPDFEIAGIADSFDSAEFSVSNL